MARRTLIFLLMSILISSVYSADVTYGFLRGSVKSDFDVPMANEKISITAGDQKFNTVTDATGVFTTMVPSGEVTLQVQNNTRTVKVLAGEPNEVLIQISKPGLSLTINNLPVDINYNITCGSMINTTAMSASLQKIADGKYFFNAPEDITGFYVMIYNPKITEIFPTGYVHKAWRFNTKESRRNLTMDYLTPATVSLRILNENGTAMADGTRVTGKFYCNLPVDKNYDDWLKVDIKNVNRPMPVYEKSDFVRIDTVVNNGMITLPQCMSGISYSLQLTTADGFAGMAQAINVDETGKADVDNYQFKRQKSAITVLDKAGKPAGNTDIYGSYCQDGKIKIITIRTDANGTAVFTDLPDSRVTVWGDNIPLGIIYPQALDAIYPFKTLNTSCKIRISSPNYSASGHYTCTDNFLTFSNTLNVNPSKYYTINNNFTNPVTLNVITNGDNPKYKALTFYTPFNDFGPVGSINDGAVIELTAFKPMTKQHIKVVNADKVTPATINVVKVYSEDAIKTGSNYYSSLTRTEVTDDGFDLWYSIPGYYRVYIDTLDSFDSPAAIINLPSKNNVVISLPEITGTVPGGSLVSWINYDDPMDVHIMKFLMKNKEMPVYADNKKVIAWWCRTSPRDMRVWKENKVTDMTLRRFTVKQVDDAGKLLQPKESNNYNQLSMLFPYMKFADDRLQTPLSTLGSISNSENTDIKLPNKSSVNLWTTKYILNMKNTAIAPSVLNITKDTPEEIILTKNSVKKDDAVMVKTNLTFFSSTGKSYNNISNDIKLYFDGDSDNPYMYSNNRSFQIVLPKDAKKITVVYPMVGILQDYVFTVNNGQISLDMDNFKPLKTLTGKVIDTVGNPAKSAYVTLRCASMSDSNCLINVNAISDGDGNFTISNVPSGLYALLIRDVSSKYICNLMVQVTDDKTDVACTAKLVENTGKSANYSNIQAGNTGYISNYLWWISPLKAVPVPINTEIPAEMPDDEVYFNGVSNCDIMPLPANQPANEFLGENVKKGTYYYFSASLARNINQGFNDAKWSRQTGGESVFKALPDISLITDIQDDFNYPSMAMIIGDGVWKDVKYRVLLNWYAYTGLNTAVCKISGLPPGKWKIKIIGTKTMEKEFVMRDYSKTIKLEVK